MNEKEKNKLKFQLILILRQNIWQLMSIGIFSFVLALGNIQNLYPLKYGYSREISYDLSWLLVMFANINVVLTNGYQQTAAYFLDKGYTRKKYYKGNVIFSLIGSLIITMATFTIYSIYLLNDKLYNLKGVVYYMGFHFMGFTAYSYIKIIIITFIVINLICAFANFISVMSFSSKLLRIILNLFIFGSLFLILFKEGLSVMLVNLVFYMNKTFSIAILFHITASVLLYIAAEKIFMHIDID